MGEASIFVPLKQAADATDLAIPLICLDLACLNFPLDSLLGNIPPSIINLRYVRSSSSFKIVPEKVFVLNAPGDIRFAQVALSDELAESSATKGRTILKLTHTKAHDHDEDEEEEDVDEADGHAEGTVTIASLIPGVVSPVFLGIV